MNRSERRAARFGRPSALQPRKPLPPIEIYWMEPPVFDPPTSPEPKRAGVSAEGATPKNNAPSPPEAEVVE